MGRFAWQDERSDWKELWRHIALALGGALLVLHVVGGLVPGGKEDWSMVTLIIVLLAVAGLGAIVRMSIRAKSQMVNEYFQYAVGAYAIFNDEDAKTAAIAAAKVVDRHFRNVMIMYVSGRISDFARSKENESESVIRRMSEVERAISVKEWNVGDGWDEKERLKKCNPEYLNALNTADPNIFVHKYPNLLDSWLGS